MSHILEDSLDEFPNNNYGFILIGGFMFSESTMTFPNRNRLTTFLMKDSYIQYSEIIRNNNLIELICDLFAGNEFNDSADIEQTVKCVMLIKKDNIPTSQSKTIEKIFINALHNYIDRERSAWISSANLIFNQLRHSKL